MPPALLLHLSRAASCSSVLCFSLACLLAAFPFAVADDHIVGANRGWQLPANSGVNLNYTQWAGNETFYLGDYITFHYQKDMHSVFEVNYSTYVNCTFSMYYGHDWIYNWSTKGGRSVIPLNQTRPYYFACGVNNHCQQGMKVAINVKSLPANKTSNSTGGGSANTSDATSVLVTAIVLMGAFLFINVSLFL